MKILLNTILWVVPHKFNLLPVSKTSRMICNFVQKKKSQKWNTDSQVLNFGNCFSTSSSASKKGGMNVRSRKEIPHISKSFSDIEELEDDKFSSLVSQLSGSLLGVSSIAVLQPWIKWGRDKRQETKPELLLEESCSLVKSIPFISVSYKEYVPVQQISKTQIFGSGTIERLREEIRVSGSQAVFISVEHLSRTQKSEVEKQLRKPVFDRYFIVLSIFKHHANTTETRLQIAMAELPILSKKFLNEKERLMVNKREAKLKQALKRVSERRNRVRKTRNDASISSVAVIGYTNCGKTSLIRALTGDERARGEDRLFATLDVTAHKGLLPSGLNVLFLDSVGFIQDIPTSLISAFQATLEDSIYSDVILLVRDISHPDVSNQTSTVYQTLKSLPLPEETPVIVVNNKVDLLEETEKLEMSENGIFASAITGEGLSEVVKAVQREVLRVSGRKIYKMKLLTGSSEITWLKETVGVSYEEVDEQNPQYTRLLVVMNQAEKAAFRKAFKGK